MGQMFETKIDFSSSLKTVSVALNGLLKEPGSVTQVKNHYAIPEKNKNIAKDAETAYLYQNVLGRLRGAEITLDEAEEGKTTLTRDIGKNFGLPYSYEKGRDNCLLKTDKEFTVKDFIYNIYEQHKYNEELICSPWNPGVFISDTDNFVTLMYAKAYAERPDFALSESEYETLYRLAHEYIKTTKWDKIFLIKPRPKGIVDDGYRYMGDSDYKIRVKFYNHLKSLYDEAGFEYEEIDGTYYENFLKVKEYIDSLYEEEHNEF